MIVPTLMSLVMKVKILNWEKPAPRSKRSILSLSNQDTSGPCDVENTPVWLKNKCVKPKRQKNIAFDGSLLNVALVPNLRAMPLPLDNGLSAATLRF